MCDFLSFVLSKSPDGLRVYSSPDLVSHGEAFVIYNLDGRNTFEFEWNDDDVIDVRLPWYENEAKAKYYERWIRKRWSRRQMLVNEFIETHLTEGRMPDLSHYEYPGWNSKTMCLFASDCAEHALKGIKSLGELDRLVLLESVRIARQYFGKERAYYAKIMINHMLSMLLKPLGERERTILESSRDLVKALVEMLVGGDRFLYAVFKKAQCARAYSVSIDEPGWSTARQKEKEWQIAHFQKTLRGLR